MGEKIAFYTEDNEEILFEVLEQTTLNGCVYLLVCEDSDENDDEADAYIMKQVETDGENITYEMVEDDKELDAVSSVFAQLIDEDTELVKGE